MTNTQTLSPEDQALLEKPFRVDEHGFLQGKPYIKKSAIRRRLSAVDPGWSQAEPAFVTRDGDVVFYSLSLTVRGVTRSNLGSGIVQTSKTNKDTGEITEYTGFELARNVAKAHKQAASDGLPRAAETFNVGAYLKEIPPGVKVSTPEALKAYLDKVTPPPAETAPDLDSASLVFLENLSQKHLMQPLSDTLKTLGLPNIADFARKHRTLDAASKVIAAAIVDQRLAVNVYRATTERAKNDSLYLSLNFGFNGVSVFDKQIAELFPGELFSLGDWQQPNFFHDFQPPLRIIMGRDGKGYPRVEYVEPQEESAQV